LLIYFFFFTPRYAASAPFADVYAYATLRACASADAATPRRHTLMLPLRRHAPPLAACHYHFLPCMPYTLTHDAATIIRCRQLALLRHAMMPICYASAMISLLIRQLPCAMKNDMVYRHAACRHLLRCFIYCLYAFAIVSLR